MKQNRRAFFFALAVGLLVLVVPQTSSAKMIASDKTVNVPATETIDDNYIVAAGTINVAGKVSNDVIAFGGSVDVSGTVGGDVIVFGGTVRVNGDVAGNVRVFGGTVDVGGKVGKNVTAIGGTVRVASDATIGWHVSAYGGTVDVRGSVGQNLDAGAGNLTLGATVGGSVKAYVGGDKETQLSLLPEAKVAKDFEYTGVTTVEVPENVVAGAVNFVKSEQNKKAQNWVVWGSVLFSLIALLILTIFVVAVADKRMQNVLQVAHTKMWLAVLVGFLAAFGLPMLAFILLFTVIGIPVSIILLATFFVTTLLSPVVGALLVGKELMRWLPWLGTSRVVQVLVGVLVYVVLTSLPFIGWAFWMFGWWLGMGALLVSLVSWLRAGEAPVVVEQTKA